MKSCYEILLCEILLILILLISNATGPPGPLAAAGVVYTRWGRTVCPNTTGTQLVYAGRAAGSGHHETGGGSNYICLPETPQYYSTNTAGAQSHRGFLYGTEYQASHALDIGPLQYMGDNNIPCAVCFTSNRATVLMVPARFSCPSGWTLEYYGYLMSNNALWQRTMFECVDKHPESIPGSAADTDGALFYHTEVRCNGIPCPPYRTDYELSCAVCTK